MILRQRRALFRADASAQIGGGHVMRSLVLADGLAANGWCCVFACRAETLSTVPVLADRAYTLVELQTEDEAAELADKLPGPVDLLVVDHYHRDVVFHKACRPWVDRILVIDELADRQYDCDILLDQTINRVADDYRGLVSGHCHLITGPDFCLLRPEFAEQRVAAVNRRQQITGIEKILVSFGAVDGNNLTGLAIQALQDAECTADIDIILGANAVHASAVGKLAADSPCQVSLHTQVNDMAAWIARADLAIGAAGMSTWERCCLGLPSLVIVDAENQRLNAEGLQAAGAGITPGSGAEINSRMISDAYEYINGDMKILRDMANAAAAICDGRGVSRLMVELLQ